MKRVKEQERFYPTGSYQRLDLFLKVLRVLCPNLRSKEIFTGQIFNHKLLTREKNATLCQTFGTNRMSVCLADPRLQSDSRHVKVSCGDTAL